MDSSAERPFYHAPVMLDEVLHFLDCAPNKNFADLTLGGAGHSEAILKANAPLGQLLGVDRDLQALAHAKNRLAEYASRTQFVHSEMSRCGTVIESYGTSKLDGVLMDFGVSSRQLDDPERGFSFMKNGPLDMRMNSTLEFTALDLVRSSDEEELARIIFEWGEERFSRRIARGIAECNPEKLKTTKDLVDVIHKALPKQVQGKKRTNCIARTFQGIRIAVNQELEEITEALTWLIEHLCDGVRIVVLTFHSLEDRIAKNIFRDAEKEGKLVRLNKRVVKPSEQETARNPRARSAKLRAVRMGSSEKKKKWSAK